MNKHQKIIFIPLVIAVLLTNCKSANNTQKGTGIGVAAGATAGALIGGGGKSSVFGALIGAAIAFLLESLCWRTWPMMARRSASGRLRKALCQSGSRTWRRNAW